MTGEEKLAEEYFKKTYPSYIGCDKFTEDIKDAVIYGLNARKPEWHKVADGDLPKEEAEYLVIFESDGTRYRGLESYYPDTKEWSTICNIIAWCEIPKYTEG